MPTAAPEPIALAPEPIAIAKPDAVSRARGALWGQFIGDALAMPVHWYYDRAALAQDYGQVAGYVAPKNPHPGSILWRSRYEAMNPRGEILHDQARFWGAAGAGVHYHQGLAAGENTLNFQLAAELLDSLHARDGYDLADYTARYLGFLLTPGRHRDTYVEECHRNFFTRYAQGYPPDQCAAEDIHIGGLAGVAGIAVFYRHDVAAAKRNAVAHVALTHAGRLVREATEVYVELLVNLLNGADLRAEIRRIITSAPGRRSVGWLCARPLERWLPLADEKVVGGRLSSACYLEDSFPAVLYLALKYADSFERGLVVNTNLGGDNCHRGGVLGAILGAALGEAAIPAALVSGMQDAERLRALIGKVAP